MNPTITETSITLVAVGMACFTMGKLAQYYTNPVHKPCIANYHSTTFPWFGKSEQQMLEDDTPFKEQTGSDIKTPRDMILRVIDQEHSDPRFAFNDGTRTEIFVNERTGKEFIVPGGCFVGSVDISGDPLLYSVKFK